jgi:DNA-binding NarL/FixJ family response regulator
MSLGRSNREISSNLSLSEEVVNTSSRAIFRKLGAQDRAHAVALGFRGGMLT